MQRRSPAPMSVWRPLNLDDFLIGAPHYPEQVDESYWARDAKRIAAAGFNVTRMGEFAWHIFEPREGQFDFSLFDKAIEVSGAEGVKTIMCTPTATPPRWLTAKYPDVLRVDESGRVAGHGSRQHADTCSPAYRDHSQPHHGGDGRALPGQPVVIGWQTDNELNTTVSPSYSGRRNANSVATCKGATTRSRNSIVLGAVDFWATAYDNFDQVGLPHNANP